MIRASIDLLRLVGIGLMMASMVTGNIWAQQTPDAGSILRQTEQKGPRIPPTLAPRPASAAPVPRKPGEVLFKVARFRLEGVGLVPEAAVQAALAPYLNREIGFSDLERAMADVALAYERQGWLARAVVPEQYIEDATVRLRVIEARMGRIRFDGAASSRLSEERIRKTMLAQQRPGEPLNLRLVERAVSVLADTPGATVSAAFANGEREAETDVVLTVGDRDRLSGSVMLDNAGGRSTGAARGLANLSVDNAMGWGEQLGVTAMGTRGTRYGMASLSWPLGYHGLRVGVSASHLTYELVGSFAASAAQGSASTLGLRAQYPLARSSSYKINASLNVDAKRFDNEANGVVTSAKSLAALTVSLSGDATDELWGGGYVLWSATLIDGELDLSANAANAAADESGPRTAGRYTRASASVARLQRITESTTLWLSASAQVSNRNLDSSEKFVLGGSSLVRGYPGSEGAGDRGWLATVELRGNLSAVWQLAGFIDHGQIQINQDARHVAASTTVPNRYSLSAVGLAVSFNPSTAASFKLTVAQRLGRNPAANPVSGADSDGTLTKPRAWLSAGYLF